MAKEVNKEEKKERKPWRDIVSARNPELNMEDDEAVGDYLDGQFRAYDEAENGRQMLNEVLARDERAAGILDGLANGDEDYSLTAYLLDAYWDDINEAASKEEAIERARVREAESMKQAADEAKRKEEAAANLKISDEALTEAVNAANVDEKNVGEMLAWLYGSDEQEGAAHRLLKHSLTTEDWTHFLHAFNMERDAESARMEGQRAAKNARGAAHRRMERELPTDLGGGAAGGASEEPTDPTLSAYRSMRPKYS